MDRLKPWILASRPKTLGAALAPVLVGSVIGWKLSGHFSAWLLFATLASCTCLQIATNLFNDAVDALKGSDTKERLGPVRITASGMMTPRAVMLVAAATLGLAVLFALPLIQARGWPIIAIGIPSLWFCYGYTGGPMPLAYRGLGELFVILFFGFVAVAGSAFVQSGAWHPEAFVAGWQVGMLSTVLIAINNLRDIAEDTKTGKRTLAVRFGVKFAKWEIFLLATMTPLIGFFVWFAMGYPWLAILPGIAAQPVAWLALQIWKTPPSPVYNKYLAMSGAGLILFALVFCLTTIYLVR